MKAGQIGEWSAETVLSYQGFTIAFDDLTATIEASDADIVP